MARSKPSCIQVDLAIVEIELEAHVGCRVMSLDQRRQVQQTEGGSSAVSCPGVPWPATRQFRFLNVGENGDTARSRPVRCR
jgi:hypothetical protein